jgi:hypothetical protein
LQLVQTRFNQSGALESIEGSEIILPFDMVIKAVGQQKQSDWLMKIFPELKLNRNGTMGRDFETGQTSLRHVFAGGDCANGGREVVNAVGEGKKAARGMHKMFCEATVVGPIQPSRWGVPDGPYGSGLDAPIRVPELEEKYEQISPALAPGARGQRPHLHQPGMKSRPGWQCCSVSLSATSARRALDLLSPNYIPQRTADATE